jgi:hypothetical protein
MNSENWSLEIVVWDRISCTVYTMDERLLDGELLWRAVTSCANFNVSSGQGRFCTEAERPVFVVKLWRGRRWRCCAPPWRSGKAAWCGLNLLSSTTRWGPEYTFGTLAVDALKFSIEKITMYSWCQMHLHSPWRSSLFQCCEASERVQTAASATSEVLFWKRYHTQQSLTRQHAELSTSWFLRFLWNETDFRHSTKSWRWWFDVSQCQRLDHASSIEMMSHFNLARSLEVSCCSKGSDLALY